MLVVIAAFIMLFVPGLGRVGEMLLEPGYALPQVYWGGVHDPLQFLAVACINWILYTALFAAVVWYRRKEKRDRRGFCLMLSLWRRMSYHGKEGQEAVKISPQIITVI